jgi:hypothetical protein
LIAAGVPATRILEIYTARANEIFTPPKIIADPRRLIDGYMYDPANIQKVLISEFGATAGWVLNDSLIRLLLTSGIDTHPWYFVRDNPKNAETTGKLGLIAARWPAPPRPHISVHGPYRSAAKQPCWWMAAAMDWNAILRARG